MSNYFGTDIDQARTIVAKAERKARRKVGWSIAGLVWDYFWLGVCYVMLPINLIQQDWWDVAFLLVILALDRSNLRNAKKRLARKRHTQAVLFEWGRELADR